MKTQFVPKLTVAVAGVLLALTGCVASPAPTPVHTADATHTVKENGNGRIDSGESMTIPSNVKDMKGVACQITKSGKLTAVNAQQVNGFGQFAKQFVTKPDTINAASGITSSADAAKIASIYIPLSQRIYDATLKANIALPTDVKAPLSAICAGDIFAGAK